MNVIEKDPDSVEPYGVNWTDWLAGLVDTDGTDTISTSVWSLTGPDSDLTLTDDGIVTGDLRTTVRLNGGTLGERYTVTNRITTVSGAVGDASVIVLIADA